MDEKRLPGANWRPVPSSPPPDEVELSVAAAEDEFRRALAAALAATRTARRFAIAARDARDVGVAKAALAALIPALDTLDAALDTLGAARLKTSAARAAAGW
jgi:hypothetical protein